MTDFKVNSFTRIPFQLGCESTLLVGSNWVAFPNGLFMDTVSVSLFKSLPPNLKSHPLFKDYLSNFKDQVNDSVTEDMIGYTYWGCEDTDWAMQLSRNSSVKFSWLQAPVGEEPARTVVFMVFEHGSTTYVYVLWVGTNTSDVYEQIWELNLGYGTTRRVIESLCSYTFGATFDGPRSLRFGQLRSQVGSYGKFLTTYNSPVTLSDRPIGRVVASSAASSTNERLAIVPDLPNRSLPHNPVLSLDDYEPLRVVMEQVSAEIPSLDVPFPNDSILSPKLLSVYSTFPDGFLFI